MVHRATVFIHHRWSVRIHSLVCEPDMTDYRVMVYCPNCKKVTPHGTVWGQDLWICLTCDKKHK